MRKYKEVNFARVKKDYEQSPVAEYAVKGGVALPLAIAGAVGLNEGLKSADTFTRANIARTTPRLTKAVNTLGSELSSNMIHLNNDLGAISARLKTAGNVATRDEKIILSTILAENKVALDEAVKDLAAIKGEGDEVVKRLRAASEKAKTSSIISSGSKLPNAGLSNSIDELLIYKNKVLKEISKDREIYNKFQSTINHGLKSAAKSIPNSAKLAVSNLQGAGYLFANSAKHMKEVGRAAGTATGRTALAGIKGAGSIGKAGAKLGLASTGGLIREIICTPFSAARGTLGGMGKFLTASPTRTAALVATGAGLSAANALYSNSKIKKGYAYNQYALGQAQNQYRTPLQGGSYYVTFENIKTGSAKVVASADTRAKARELLVSNNLVSYDPDVIVKVHIGKALTNLYPMQFYAV